MADFQNPFLRGFLGAQDAVDRSNSSQIQQATGLLGLQGAMQAQQEKGLMRQAAVMGPDGQLDSKATLSNLYRISPEIGLKFQQSLQKEHPFSKVDAKDYTPDSVARFAQTHDYSHLVPVRKNEYLNTGTGFQPINPYSNQSMGQPIPIRVSPNTQARLAQDQQHWTGLSAADAARLGISSDQHFWETGRRPGPLQMGPVQGTPLPVPAPNQPPPRPGTPPMMGPQALNAVAPQSAVTNPAMAADASRIRQAELQPGGGGMIPSASILPPRGAVMQNVPPRDQAKLTIEQPHAQTSASTTLQNLDRMDSMASELISHPGLTDITGKVNQYSVLDVLPQTRGARGLSGSLTKQVGVAALQSMRDASKTGGAVGQVTEKEWPILQQSIAALDESQATGDYQTALVNLQNQIRSSKQRIRQAYEATYGPLQYEAPKYQKQGQPLPATNQTGLANENLDILKRADAILSGQR